MKRGETHLVLRDLADTILTPPALINLLDLVKDLEPRQEPCVFKVSPARDGEGERVLVAVRRRRVVRWTRKRLGWDGSASSANGGAGVHFEHVALRREDHVRVVVVEGVVLATQWLSTESNRVLKREDAHLVECQVKVLERLGRDKARLFVFERASVEVF